MRYSALQSNSGSDKEIFNSVLNSWKFQYRAGEKNAFELQSSKIKSMVFAKISYLLDGNIVSGRWKRCFSSGIAVFSALSVW
ncbi:hypothetical protein [Azospirillum doebereinerae]